MSNLAQRLLTAAIVVPVLVYLFYRGGLAFIVLIELAVAIGINEYYRMAEKRGFFPRRVLGTAGALVLGAIAVSGRLDYMALFITCLFLVILAAQLKSLDLSTAISGSAVTIFGVIYIGWLLSHAILIRFPPSPPGSNDLGFFFIVLAIAGTFLADAGAFFLGRALGRRKLAPLISPGKTWEGVAGAVIGATAGVILAKLVFDRWIFGEGGTGLPLFHGFILGPLLAAATVVGDLFESMLKRDAKVKDSSRIIPGHGGIMDRLDSILFSVPVTYCYLRWIVYGAWW